MWKPWRMYIRMLGIHTFGFFNQCAFSRWFWMDGSKFMVDLSTFSSPSSNVPGGQYPRQHPAVACPGLKSSAWLSWHLNVFLQSLYHFSMPHCSTNKTAWEVALQRPFAQDFKSQVFTKLHTDSLPRKPSLQWSILQTSLRALGAGSPICGPWFLDLLKNHAARSNKALCDAIHVAFHESNFNRIHTT